MASSTTDPALVLHRNRGPHDDVETNTDLHKLAYSPGPRDTDVDIFELERKYIWREERTWPFLLERTWPFLFNRCDLFGPVPLICLRPSSSFTAPPEPLPLREETQTADTMLASRATGKAFRVHSRIFADVERISPLHALSLRGARVEAPAEIEPDVLDAIIDVLYALAHNKEAGVASAFVEYDDLASVWSAATVLDLDSVKARIIATIRLCLSLHNVVYFLEVSQALDMPGIVMACADLIASDPEAALSSPGTDKSPRNRCEQTLFSFLLPNPTFFLEHLL